MSPNMQIPVNAHVPSIKDGTNLVLRSPFCAISFSEAAILLVSDRAAHDKRDPYWGRGCVFSHYCVFVWTAKNIIQEKHRSTKIRNLESGYGIMETETETETEAENGIKHQ